MLALLCRVVRAGRVAECIALLTLLYRVVRAGRVAECIALLALLCRVVTAGRVAEFLPSFKFPQLQVIFPTLYIVLIIKIIEWAEILKGVFS